MAKAGHETTAAARLMIGAACVIAAVAGCASGNPGGNTGSGGMTEATGGTGLTATGGATGGSGMTGGAGMTGGTATGGRAIATGGQGGGATAGTSGSVAGHGGSSGTSGVAGRGSGGAANGGAAAVGTGSGGATASSMEDDGADCTVGALADSGSLPAIAKLPDPFKKLDGTRMTTKAEWRCRREEIRKMEEKYVYGTKPPPPQSVTGTVTSSTITVQVMDNGKSASFTAGVKLPTSGSAPYPVIVEYCSDTSGTFGPPLDTGVLNSEGVAVIYYNAYAVGAEGHGHGASQSGAFYNVYAGGSATSLLTAWGWGVSRIIDVIAKSGSGMLKADAVAVSGCSRFGKGAFIAGVIDQRIALTMPVESGTAGVPIWRGVNGEGGQTLSSAYGEQPWFADAFSPFTSSPTKAPLDTHELIAMVAPRGLFIMDNPHIANLGPKSAHVAALAGAEVYKALGAGDAITYYSDVQNGTHCSQRPEWAAPLKSNIERFLKRTGADPGVIKASSAATGKLSDWSDWTTPTLN
ncbi:MAG: cellulose-binding protein [Polyangia bacterium]